MQIVMDDSEYSYVASTKIITLASPYNALSVGQIIRITNFTTGSVFYESKTQKYPISISGEDITHTYDDDNDADADKLQIIVDVWAHVLDEQPFNAQAADGSASAVDVLGYSDLGFTVTDAVCDGVITVTDELGAPLSFLLDNIVVTSFTGAGSGTNYHHCQIVNCKPKQVIFILTSRTTGSVSIDLRGL